MNKKLEEKNTKKRAADLINESIKDIDSGSKGIDGDIFFEKVKQKYSN